MNRLRVRVGEKIVERTIKPAVGEALLWVEDEIDTILDKEFHFGPYQLDYIGEFAWDIFVDGQKIGHAKAWDEKPPEAKVPEKTLWEWLLIVGLTYLALC